MKRFALVLLSVFISFFSPKAQSSKTSSLLWKISGKGIQAPSYIYGTFHLLCPDDFVMDTAVKQAFHQTKQLYLEIDMTDPSITAKMMTQLVMKDGHTLKDYISKTDFDSCSAIFLNKAGLPLPLLATYKPYMLTSFLYPAMLGCTPVAFELEFAKMAKQDSIPVKGLETVEFQMGIFDEIPYAEQAKMLVKSLYEFDQSKKELKELVQQYKQKDIAVLQSSIEDDKDFGQYEAVLLNKRNANWIPQIITQSSSMPTFYAVGAGHLGGDKGVINLLKQQGFVVTPVIY